MDGWVGSGWVVGGGGGGSGWGGGWIDRYLFGSVAQQLSF